MAALYDRIVNNEIKMKDDGLMGPAPAGQPGDMANHARNIFNTLLSLMGATKQQVGGSVGGRGATGPLTLPPPNLQPPTSDP